MARSVEMPTKLKSKSESNKSNKKQMSDWSHPFSLSNQCVYQYIILYCETGLCRFPLGVQKYSTYPPETEYGGKKRNGMHTDRSCG